MFSQPSYISIGDEYDKTKALAPDRCKGVQMKVAAAKRGTQPDALFDKKFKSLSEGDKYIDPGVVEKRDRIENRKKLVTNDGFKYSSPSMRSAGLGNNYGCFTKQYKHETEYIVTKKGELPNKAKDAPRNILTGPPKRGTYGTPGTTLSKGDEYKYISDPYDANNRAAGDKKGAPIPFKAACKKTDFFDGHSNVAASKIYSLDRPLPARKPEPPASKPAATVPFKPSSPPKRGFNSTMGKIEYREDPFELREKKAREEREKNKPSVVWKPVGATKTLPTRSIAFNASAADAA